MVHSESTMVLKSSAFSLNSIVNLGGEIQCGEMECLSACTACAMVPSRAPSPLPTTVSPTAMPTAAPTTEQARTDVNAQSRLVSGLSAGCLALLAIGVVVVTRYRTGRPCGFGLSLNPDGGAPELPSNQQSLLQLENGTTVPASVELVERSVMVKSYETSPAPVFVVGRDSMRITLWSPGMAIAAPTLRNPVGSLLSDLPFVKASDQARLDQFLRCIFEAPAEHDHAQTFMLHLRAKSSLVLLEMVATHFFVRDSEPIIVMTGRQIDSDLAVLLASGTVIATSEANHDVLGDDVCWGESPYLVSVSQAGSIKDDDDDNVLLPINDHVPGVTSSVISALSLPTLEEASRIDGSSVSSLTMPTMAPRIGGSTVSSLTTPTMAPRIGGSTVSSLTTPTMAPGHSIDSLSIRTVQPVHPSSHGVRDRARIIAREMLISELASSTTGDSSTNSATASVVFVDRSELSDM